MPRLFIVFTLLVQYAVLPAQTPYLSHLNVTADDPLYTTYAAQMERSEFTLDEGYHLQFYKPEEGVKYITDTAGDWGIGFKLGDKFVYKIEDMAEQPVISLSYTDMVRYSFFPFEDIRVDASFLVYSSHFAIQDLQITNLRDSDTTLKVYTILDNTYRDFNRINVTEKQSGVSFYHEELPDSWVLSHGVPYVDEVQNIFLLSEPTDNISTFHSFDTTDIELPRPVDLAEPEQYSIQGDILHADGSRCRHGVPDAEILVYVNNEPDRILTHTAPKFGTTRANISGYGSYSIDLGNLPGIKNGDIITTHFFCYARSESISSVDTVTQLTETNEHQVNLHLKPAGQQLERMPLERRFSRDGNSIELRFDPDPDKSYKMYRRDYNQHGYYKIIASGSNGEFKDKLDDEDLAEYVVVSFSRRDSVLSVSEIVNSAGTLNFMDSVDGSESSRTLQSQITKVISLRNTILVRSGQSEELRAIRGVSRPDEPLADLSRRASELLHVDFEPFIRANEKMYSRIPDIQFTSEDEKLLYWSAFTLMRQVMLPPEGKAGYNYYVFSREPTWGWGHGGQVFHESLTMLAYALMDPTSAMNSQRVYRERQYENGYINYRTGSYLDETIPVNGQLTTSAPWYAWQNWEVYKLTGDREFLEEMYASAKSFYQYYVTNRDSDQDGLCEWGAHAILESVRDARVAVWDEVAWPTHFEAMDLNAMLVSEEKALANMARELGYNTQAIEWEAAAGHRTQLINNAMWDDETGFYYQVDKIDHDFSYQEPNDLKRQELIGFLPLWAGVATESQADRLVKHMTDPEKFWREFGIPSLAADDPYYDPEGYWNGPVWVEWQYLFLRGLLDYGYHEVAAQLVDKVAAGMISQLRENHTFWEFYSPDSQWGGHHQTYIWAGLIAKMLHEVR